MHAHASPPPGGASDYTALCRDRVTEKLVTHPAPCLPKASRALSELCRLRFLWQKVKLGFHRVVETTRPIKITIGLTAFGFWGQTTRTN